MEIDLLLLSHKRKFKCIYVINRSNNKTCYVYSAFHGAKITLQAIKNGPNWFQTKSAQ